MRTRVLTLATALAVAALMVPAPAQADARVSVRNDQGGSKADPKYATVMTLNGSGFQSIKGGHGGVYIFFGIKVSGGYLYVPDSETKNNKGFQRFVAFPGSDTAGSANGGTIKANGSWSTQILIPGATFKAVNRSGKAQTVNCLKSTCGIITVGAHGVKNKRNETFTPISFGDLYGGRAPSAAATTAAPEAPDVEKPKSTGKPALTIDRKSAVAGRVLSFHASGLTPGDQLAASLDDGVAAVGPLSVGANGQLAGVLQLPADLSVGTHVLTLTGGASTPTVSFPVAAGAPVEAAVQDDETPVGAIVYVGAAALLLIAAATFAIRRFRKARHA